LVERGGSSCIRNATPHLLLHAWCKKKALGYVIVVRELVERGGSSCIRNATPHSTSSAACMVQKEGTEVPHSGA